MRTLNASTAFLIDTNILVYSIDGRNYKKRERSAEVLTRLAQSRRASLSVQVLGEFYSRTTRERGRILSDEEAEIDVALFGDSLGPIWDLHSDFVPAAIRVSRRYRTSYWDGLLIVTAHANGVESLLTEDLQDGQLIEGVRILNPLREDFDLSLLD